MENLYIFWHPLAAFKVAHRFQDEYNLHWAKCLGEAGASYCASPPFSFDSYKNYIISHLVPEFMPNFKAFIFIEIYPNYLNKMMKGYILNLAKCLDYIIELPEYLPSAL